MNKNQFLLVFLTLLVIGCFDNCEGDCTVDPDLTIDLLVPAADVIRGEPADWEYVVESVKENSENCEVLAAGASIAQILIDLFSDPTDEEGEEFYKNNSDIAALKAGATAKVTSAIAFNSVGVHLISTVADLNDDVEERNEDNNADIAQIEIKASDDIFSKTSFEFKEKLRTTVAIVVVGDSIIGGRPTSYQGIPIYYAQ